MTDVRAASADSRYPSLDVVRGVGVMGILLLNIVAFGMPMAAYFNPLAYGDASPLDIAAWGTNFVLFDGKMRGLFSVLFGASMLLVAERAEAKGANGALTSYSRLSWLLLFGAVHAYAIWFGDILMLYAVTGAIAFLFRRAETHRLVALGLMFIIAEAILLGLLALSLWNLRTAALAPDADVALAEQWVAIQNAFGPVAPDALARDLALYRGSYGEILAYRLGPGLWKPITGNLLSIFETLGLMLLGMAGLKSGFLTGEWDRSAYARIARIGYLVGLPALACLALLVMWSGFDTVMVFFCGLALRTLANPPVVLAHAALIILWVKSAGGSALVARVGAAGRAAFTNYVGTSIVCTTIFYGYGFGLFGELGRAALYLVVVGVWALMLLWSKPWLDRFRYGPLEWLWRSLSRRQLQPMRR